ncbi:hypothetical protein [Nocardia brasiliensis]|uniref:hypothetical protein n=1 Tax=Nocardia brasiliensis TaxID=37326 RepID=UPI002456C7EB|nr:hypothetical protein [Nocardia brasiliensis]
MSGRREMAQAAINSRDFAAANVHALLYLADEQRAANLIALLNPALDTQDRVSGWEVSTAVQEYLEGWR